MDKIMTLSDCILDQMADAVIYADITGMIERWNKSAAMLFGYSASEALGQSLDLIIPERLRTAHWKGFDAAVKSGKTRLQGHPTLTRAVTKDNRKLYVEMTFALVVDQDGNSLGSVAVARDVTEKIEKEKALVQG